jgi:hypothetical protein
MTVDSGETKLWRTTMAVIKRLSDSRRLRARYAILLLSIIVAFVLQGVGSTGKIEQVVVSAVLAVTLLLALWAADARRWVMWLASIVCGLVVLTSVISSIEGHIDSGATRLANLLLVTLAPPAIILGVVRNLRARNRVTGEAVFGVLCLYILLGMAFAFLYGALDRITGTPFFAQNVQATEARCLYFSFTTLTTIGYGDLTAASNLGHTLSVSEGLLGQIYLVTIVSLIVGNLGRTRQRAGAE